MVPIATRNSKILTGNGDLKKISQLVAWPPASLPCSNWKVSELEMVRYLLGVHLKYQCLRPMNCRIHKDIGHRDYKGTTL